MNVGVLMVLVLLRAEPIEFAGSYVRIGEAVKTTAQGKPCVIHGTIWVEGRSYVPLDDRLTVNGLLVQFDNENGAYALSPRSFPTGVRLSLPGYAPVEYVLDTCVSPVTLHLAFSRPVTPVLATLGWGPCELDCPAYRLRIYEDGRVEWQEAVPPPSGVRDLPAFAKLSASELERVNKAFADARFLQLAQEAECETSDFPHFALGLFSGGRLHRLEVNWGCDSSQARLLYELSARLEAIVHIERWLGAPRPYSPPLVWPDTH